MGQVARDGGLRRRYGNQDGQAAVVDLATRHNIKISDEVLS
jgi:hypothetical protein